MNNIEAIICLLLLFMGVPDLCKRLRRPSLIYCVFVLFGILIGPLVALDVGGMLKKAGEVGFLLLLFEVGLEIELPPLREFLLSLRFATTWSLFQYPIIVALALVAGFDVTEGLVGAAALTGCSVGMSHLAWKFYPGLTDEVRTRLLRIMVAMEMLAIVVLAVNSVALERGIHWMILVRITGIAIVILTVNRFASHLEQLFQKIIERTTHWRMHLLVLLVLAVCAIGERLGLSAAKTAFFMGLFMSRARHNGMALDEHMAPISQRFLIPLFFVSLGMQVEWSMLFSAIGLLAFCSAFFLIGLREVMNRRFFPTGADSRAFLLFCPNLTMVAVGGHTLIENHRSADIAAWLVLTGMFMSVTAVLLLTAPNSSSPAATVTAPPTGG